MVGSELADPCGGLGQEPFCPEKRKLSRQKSLLISLALMVSSLVCSLGGLEAIAWSWERRQSRGPYAWELVASRRIRIDRFGSGDSGYTLAHPGETYTWRDTFVQINSQGLRGPEFERAKPPGTYRILVVGDSVVFGWGIAYEDTYSHQLQTMLDKSDGDGETRYQVISAGIPGWNTENALAYLEAEGLAYQPDLIVLNFTVVNDVYGKNALEASRETSLDWLRGHTYFWPFLSVQYRLLEVRLGRSEAIPILNPPPEAEVYFPLREEDPHWDSVWRPIQDVARLAGEHGSDFLLVVVPTAYQAQDPTYSTVPQRVLGERAKEAGIEALDLLPEFREACRNAPAEGDCGPEDRYLWADLWMHPSALGNRLIAERVLDVVQGQD